MFDQRTLLPTGCLDIVARSKMRAAHSHHAIECERVVRCEIKRNLEALDGGFGIALVDVDPSAAAPGPRRATIDGERLADDPPRGIEIMQQGEGVAENGERRSITGESCRLPRQLRTSSEILRRRSGEMIDDTLRIRPCGERGRQRVIWIPVHRALQKISRARVAVGIERQNMRHRPERQVVWAQVEIGLSPRILNLCKAQARLKRCGNSAWRDIPWEPNAHQARHRNDTPKGDGRLPSRSV